MTRVTLLLVGEEGLTSLPVCLRKLQELSPLHKLVLTGAPLDVVRYAYEKDTGAMNKDILLDALHFCPNPEVLEFLKEVASPDSYSLADVAGVMNEILQNPQEGDFSAQQFERVFHLFPQAAVTAPGEKLDWPLTVVFHSDWLFGDDMLTAMIESIPHDAMKIDVAFHFDGHIANIAYGIDAAQVRSALNAKLKQMTNLQYLSVSLSIEDEIEQEMRTIICKHIASGNLECLIINENNSIPHRPRGSLQHFLQPIFDTISGATSNHLKSLQFHLYKIDVKPCQDRMVDILKTNTTITNAFFGTQAEFTRYEKTRVMKYYTTLNRFGRGIFRDPKTPLLDLVNKVFDVQQEEFHCPGGFDEVAVLFGLLREAPGAWSVADKKDLRSRPSLKRKASSSLDRMVASK